MDMRGQLELRVVNDLGEIEPEEWKALLRDDDNPFVEHRFLEALERSGAVASSRGWWPCHLTARHGNQLVAAAPAYAKGDSAGDFSRDWGFADAAQRNGLRYYPKLVVGVPFSPVTGRRILVRDGWNRGDLTVALMTLARELSRQSELSSVHVLYHREDEIEALARAGLATRPMIQYHWRNHGYRDVDDWLASLKSKKRTQIRRERHEPVRQRIEIRTVRGAELAADPERWADVAWSLYVRNTQKHYWGSAYLNRDFFELALHRLPDCAELVVAEKDDQIVAGAFNLATPTHLFGRYWGCHEEHRFLHFNVCLYHSIEECIERGVQFFEGGAGGEHKLARGFDPALVYTSHLFLHDQFHRALAHHFESETAALRSELHL